MWRTNLHEASGVKYRKSPAKRFTFAPLSSFVDAYAFVAMRRPLLCLLLAASTSSVRSYTGGVTSYLPFADFVGDVSSQVGAIGSSAASSARSVAFR